jgi:hypothetical protein
VNTRNMRNTRNPDVPVRVCVNTGNINRNALPCKGSIPDVPDVHPGHAANVQCGNPEPFSVVLELLPSHADEGPGINRLRRALKCLLRSYGLRYVSIVPEQPELADAKPEAKEHE